jgi:hypothetical protein
MAQKLTPVNAGDTINAQLFNAVLYILQRPAGQQETGRYWINGNAYNSSVFMSCNILTKSRGSTPVSLSIDQSDTTLFGLQAPSTGHLTSGGAQIYARVTGAGSGLFAAGGVYTMQY